MPHRSPGHAFVPMTGPAGGRDEMSGLDRPPVGHLIKSRHNECEATESAVPGSANNFQHRDCGGVGLAYGLATARTAMSDPLTSD